jgi:hypothetical protein
MGSLTRLATRLAKGLAPLALTLALLARPAAAQAPDDAAAQAAGVDPALLRALASDDYVTRDRTARRLEARADFGLREVETLLNSPGLHPEQRARIGRVGFRLFSLQDRAALGVSFDPQSRDGVRLRQVIDGFEIAGVAGAGDLVVEIGGLPLRSEERFRAEILSRLPGESIQLGLRRAGAPDDAPIERVTVGLGRLESLQNAAPPEPALLEAAWALRIERTVETTGEPTLGDGIKGRDWLEAEGRWEPGPRTSGAWPESLAFRALRPSGQPTHAGVSLALTYADRTALDRHLSSGFVERESDQITDPVERLRQTVESIRFFAREIDRTVNSPRNFDADALAKIRQAFEELRDELTKMERAQRGAGENDG